MCTVPRTACSAPSVLTITVYQNASSTVSRCDQRAAWPCSSASFQIPHPPLHLSSLNSHNHGIIQTGNHVVFYRVVLRLRFQACGLCVQLVSRSAPCQVKTLRVRIYPNSRGFCPFHQGGGSVRCSAHRSAQRRECDGVLHLLTFLFLLGEKKTIFFQAPLNLLP